MAAAPRRALVITLAFLAALVSASAGLSGPVEVESARAEDPSTDASPGPKPEPAALPERPAGPRPRPVVLAFAGDVHFEGALSPLPGRARSTLGELSTELRRADLAMVNLETALVDGDEQPAPKELEAADQRYWFSAPRAALRVLDRSGIDVASVANNHGADYGPAGLRATLAAGDRSAVSLLGAGRSPRAAFRPHRTSVRGTEVAVLAADASARESVDPTWAVAAGTGIGLASARQDRPTLLLDAVRRAARSSDLVVVYLHWGEEGLVCPTTGQQRLAEQLAAAGADVVVGSHAHVLLGSGLLDRGSADETYVGYGLGNFAWYHGRRSASGVLRLGISEGRVVDEDWVPAAIPVGGGTPRGRAEPRGPPP